MLISRICFGGIFRFLVDITGVYCKLACIVYVCIECIFVYQVILCNSTAALVVVNNIYFFNFQDVLTFY